MFVHVFLQHWRPNKFIIIIINSEMKNVTEWLRNNMLTLNVTKTNYMIMTTQGKRYNNDECKIIIDESIILIVYIIPNF